MAKDCCFPYQEVGKCSAILKPPIIHPTPCTPYRMTIRETAIRAKTEGPEPVVNPEESLDSTTGVLLELYTPEDTVRWEAAFIEHIKYIGAVPELAIS